MRKSVLGLAVLVLLGAAACSSSENIGSPELAPRGETQTTVKPTRQDLTNTVSLSGKVTMNPVFGLESPVAGEVRFLDVTKPRRTPTQPTRVANVWKDGNVHRVKVPAGATFAGRLVDDRSTVTAGMPVVSAKLAGYGIVADIDGEQAYRISGAIGSVQAQIKNGPAPFPCQVLGTIAALPEGSVPEPPKEPDPSSSPSTRPGPIVEDDGEAPPESSEPTGMRLVCTAPAGVKLINGASATLRVVTEKVANALVVPVEAVAGTQGKGKVDVVRADRTRETRDVVLGLTDGKVVQIKSGLREDDTVAVPGPNLPAAPPGEGAPEGQK